MSFDTHIIYVATQEQKKKLLKAKIAEKQANEIGMTL
jgi:hypothetical protein